MRSRLVYSLSVRIRVICVAGWDILPFYNARANWFQWSLERESRIHHILWLAAQRWVKYPTAAWRCIGITFFRRMNLLSTEVDDGDLMLPTGKFYYGTFRLHPPFDIRSSIGTNLVHSVNWKGWTDGSTTLKIFSTSAQDSPFRMGGEG